MKYTDDEVLDILNQFTDKPKECIRDWNINKSNITLDKQYNNWIYSFPIIVNDEEVANVTLVSLYGSIDDETMKRKVMQKYFGHDDYTKTFSAFSHDTYLHSYLIIHKQFELPEITNNFYGQTFIGKDSKNKQFEFNVCYGTPDSEDEDEDQELYNRWISDAYRFENGVSININKIENGWQLSKKINENIKIRLRDETINNIIT